MFRFRRRRQHPQAGRPACTRRGQLGRWVPQLEGLETRFLPAITPLAQTFSIVEGLNQNVVAAAFNDTDNVTTGNFTNVSIDWGDSTTSAGTVTQPGGAGALFLVSGTHTYADEGSKPVTVTMHDVLNNNTVTLSGNTAKITDAPLLSTGGNPTPVIGVGGNGSAGAALTALNSFTAAIGGPNNGGNPPPQNSGFRTINWDGVKLDGTDFGGSTTVIKQNSTVAIPANRFQERGALFDEPYAVSGDGFTGVNPNAAGLFPAFSPNNTFAMFNDTIIDMSFVLPSAHTTAPTPAVTRAFGAIFLNVELPNTTSIEFFSGSSSLGKYYVPVGPKSQPEFLGVLFPSPIVTSVELTLGTDVLFSFDGTNFTSNSSDNPAAGHNLVVTDDFAYAEPRLAIPNNPTLLATEGQGFQGTVGTFFDTNPSGTPADFTATIKWGDGHTSPGTIVPNGSASFNVSGTNTYSEEGSYTVNISVTDKGGSTITLTTTANVADAPLQIAGTSVVVPQGFTVSNAVLASFTDPAGAEGPANYSTQINWGDGSPVTAGVLTSTGGNNFNVLGSHQYQGPGHFTITTTINHETAASATVTSQVVLGSANDRLVAKLYLDLLHRTVDPTGLALWGGQLNAGVAPGQVALSIENSAEFKGVEVQNTYNLLLHRNVDPAGFQAGVSLLLAGGTVEQLEAILLASPEYFIKNGNNNAAWLAAVYRDILARGIDPSASITFQTALAQGLTRNQVATLLINSAEARGITTGRYFLQYLRRPADASGVNFGVSLLTAGFRDELLIANIVGSPEYSATV